MTDYTSNEFIAFYFRDARESEAALRRASEQIEEHTPYRVCDLWLSPRQRVGVLNLCAKPPGTPLSGWSRLKSDWWQALPRTNRLRLRGSMALLQTGYTTTADREFERSIRETDAGLTCCDAGGIAAFCAVRFDSDGEERLFLWSTRPGLRAIASAEAAHAVVVGTRPRLVHALTRDFRTPSLDLGYVRAALNGWSIDDHTPYDGTTLVSVDKLLRVRAGQRSLHAHPTPAFQRQERIFRKQLPRYRDAVREAIEPLRSLRGFELRLSGGKDSRLMAAALWSQGITPSTVMCQGPEESPEVAVARSVAERLGWRLQRAQPTYAYLGTLFQTVRHNLCLSDGFFATEPRHLAYQVHSLVDDIGPGMVIGHMELQKGGWTRGMGETREQLVELARKKVTRWRDCVVPELAEAATRRIDEYAAGLSFTEGAEYGYWLNYQFRVGRWLTSHFLAHSKQHLPVYPLIDEKVTRVVSCAPLKPLVTERLLAETTWAFAPALRELPTIEPYRFVVHQQQRERKKRAKAAAAASLADAASAPAPAPAAPAPEPTTASASPKKSPEPSPADRYMSGDRVAEVCAHIRGGKLREELRSLAQERIWEVIQDPTSARMHASNVRPVLLNEFLWTCYQASLLHTDGLDAW